MGNLSNVTTEQDLRKAIDAMYLADEASLVRSMVSDYDNQGFPTIRQQAHNLVVRSRELHHTPHLNKFLSEFSLSSDEGIVLMCLAEALLRIPDSATQSRLIHDKLNGPDWWSHIGHSPSFFVNATAWGLLFTGKLVKPNYDQQLEPGQFISVMLNRLGEPLIRKALHQAIQLLAEQFVAGETLSQALQHIYKHNPADTLCSFDMLGEAAITANDATLYLERYHSALIELGKYQANSDSNTLKHSISIKLSALHPRYEYAQRSRIQRELIPKLIELAQVAQQLDIPLTIDAEEAYRMELLLDCFKAVFSYPGLKHWNGLGLAVQAYQKRALAQLRWLNHLAKSHKKVIPIRLVKGAYWDTEIKLAQSQGLRSYPVFTRKQSTDINYLTCARYLLDHTHSFTPQFGTHNALTIASIQHMANVGKSYEFQRLYGMGDVLYTAYQNQTESAKSCRIYVPIGLHRDLLPYLVRRMLENGVNTSFVYQAGDPDVSPQNLLKNPVEALKQFKLTAHPAIPLPQHIYSNRRNSSGINLNSPHELQHALTQINYAATKNYQATPLIFGNTNHCPTAEQKVSSLTNQHTVIGSVNETDPSLIAAVINNSVNAQRHWSQTPVEQRARILETAADLIQENQYTLMYLCINEAGKCIQDAHNEVREAIDFCRYYAQQARLLFGIQDHFQGIVGESNKGHWQAKGTFVCISPWNFPIAIFTGQITAALVAGNSVIAKPASATPLCGMQIIKYLHQAGIPHDVLQFIPGSSNALGQGLTNDNRIDGVAFTGSISAAQKINQNLAARNAPIATLIAETGGQNVMIADSSAHIEQLVNDVVRSAFNSAGQRCSALRVLFLPKEIADDTIKSIKGAMQQLTLGDPTNESTDIGPVINSNACEKLHAHINYLRAINAAVFQIPLPHNVRKDIFFPPTLCEIKNLEQLQGEVFGPILHIIRYDQNKLDLLIQSINDTKYGLTLGIHSRIQKTVDYIKKQVHVGNIYINRDIIGATVGSQPFGGCGLSGTGPKAGGPHYLNRFANEITVSENTTAIGGNASLLMMDDNTP